MKLLGLIVVVVVLFPAPVHAQSVKLADLVGVWVKDNGDTLILQADSTFRMGLPGRKDGSVTFNFRRWNYLKGDTISFFDSKEFAKTNQTGEPGHKITLEFDGQQLTLTPLGETNKWEGGTYARPDIPAVQPLTSANLVGTWISFKGDSLILWPDSTVLWDGATRANDRSFYRWDHLAGNMISFKGDPPFLKARPEDQGFTIMLNDRKQLILGGMRFKHVGTPIPKP